MLQLGDNEVFKHSALKKSLQIIQLYPKNQDTQANVIGRYHQLPFPNSSIDVILLPHVLELEAETQPILDEAWRALAHNGQLLILGFNPWSLWGLKRFFCKEQTTAIWGSHFHSGENIRRYINKLGGEIIRYNVFFFRPPINNENFLIRSRWLEKVLRFLFPASGGVYLLIARKRTTPMQPIKERWRWLNALTEKNFEPTTRRVKCD